MSPLGPSPLLTYTSPVEHALVLLDRIWQIVAGVLTILLSAIASAHAVLRKRDSRAAVGWTGLVWFAPIVGPILYVLFGINRIQRRAAELRTPASLPATAEFEQPAPLSGQVTLPPEVRHLDTLAHLVDRVAGRPLTTGNAVEPLVNGDAAYPRMIEAIDRAQRSVALSTYIFDNDAAGRMFLAALERAVQRGVAVRVLIDAVGARYSWPSMIRELGRRGIPTARFGRTLLPWRMPYLNLRNHRKILVVDGTIGFTGGMNIRLGHLVARDPPRPVQDLHFRVAGPVVGHFMRAFAEDWAFTTREALDGPAWFPELRPVGDVIARGITDGPDADLDKARLVFLGAVGCAQRSVRIVTPYFLPDQALITALNVAALRGVKVEILIPARSNLALVQWAATHQLWQLLERGCRVYLSAAPFDHSKLLLVDDGWALIGSSNWDARSLRLNFEFDVECYSAGLAARLHQIVDAKLRTARRLSKAEVDARPLLIQLRDGIARLAAPYL